MERTHTYTLCTQHTTGFMQQDEFKNLFGSLIGLDKVISWESHEKDIGILDRKLQENPTVKTQNRAASIKLK